MEFLFLYIYILICTCKIMHTHESLISYGELDESKLVPKTGNGRNTE